MLRKIAVCMMVASVVSLLVSGSCVYAQKPSFKGVTLTVVYEGGCLHTEAILEYLPEWERLTGGKVERAGMPVYEMLEKTALELTAHSGVFDLVINPSTSVGAIEPYLLDLTDRIPDIERFGKWRLGEMTFDGKVKGIPHTQETCLLFYNKDVCAAAGLTELAPKAIDDLFQILDKIQGILPRGETKYAFARAPIWLFRGVLFPLYSGKRIMEVDPKDGLWHPTWNSKEGVQTLETILRLAKYAPPDFIAITPTEDRALFTRGEVAVIDEWPDVWVKFNDPSLSKVAGKIVTSPWPKVKYLTKTGGGWNVLVCADVKKKPAPTEEAAVHLANFLTSHGLSKKMVLACGTGSPQPAVMEELIREADPYNAAYYRSVTEAIYRCYSEPIVPTGLGIYREPLRRNIEAAILGEKAVKQALADAEKEVIEAMKDWGYYE